MEINPTTPSAVSKDFSGPPNPAQLGVKEFAAYDLVIDARSPREFAVDHVPGAKNLPVVNDEQYARVGTIHKTDTHAAYLIGVQWSLANIAQHIASEIVHFRKGSHFLVYCFRGGKRSKLWADNLRTIGFKVDVLPGGWKQYRRWVQASLEAIAPTFTLRVLSGSTGSGKTRLLHALAKAGEQVLDLEAIALHRGSLIGAVPGTPQPAQKGFDSALLNVLRGFDPARPVWLEAESKKIGNVQIPAALYESMHKTTPIKVVAPMAERVRLWREDYRHFVEDPVAMVETLSPLKPLIGQQELTLWRDLAQAGQVDELFQRVMEQHYDPCYARSQKKYYKTADEAPVLELRSLSADSLAVVAAELAGGR